MAADLASRTEGLPALQLWELVLERFTKLVFREDNQATIPILKTQKNSTLRHLNRTHRVNVSWLCEVFRNLNEVELISIVKQTRWLLTYSPRLSLTLLSGMQHWI